VKEVRLLEDILSYGKNRTVYGKKNERVKIVADFGNVLIVQGKYEKFPVIKDKVVNVTEFL